MKQKHLFVIVTFFLTGSAWTLNSEHTQMRDANQYYENLLSGKRYSSKSQAQILQEIKLALQEDLKFVNLLLNNISSQKKYLRDPSKKIPEKLCERTFSGNDWFVCFDHHEVIKAQVPINVPARQWRCFNCEVVVNKIFEKAVEITIIPDAFPILGDSNLENATWKAEVWLEAKFPTKSELNLQEIQEKILELNTCKANLKKEKSIILEKFKSFGITTSP